MNIRQELLELTPQALITLSNAGFVKRCQKALEAGKAPELILHEDGTLEARFDDGTVTSLPPESALKEAQCSCPASGMCRHRVMLVLAYQQHCAEQAPAAETPAAGRWHPGDWLTALNELPAATHRRAQTLATQGLIIELSCPSNGVPAARLPMSDVRFFSRNSLRFARCDCVEGTLCEHVILAVQAFAAAEAQQPGFEQLTWQLHAQGAEQDGTRAANPFDTVEGQACVESVNALYLTLWQDGLSQPPVGFERALKKALRAAQQLEWRWISAALQQLGDSLYAFQHRASNYDAEHTLTECAELCARLKAAHQMACLAQQGELPPQPWRTIVGQGIDGESQLDHLRLVSLGMKSAQDTEHYSAQLWFIDPDTGSLLHITRQWPLAEQTNIPLERRRIANAQIATLAGGQVVAQGAYRTAKGELKLESRARRTSTAPLSPQAWDIPQVTQCPASIRALRQHLRQRLPAFVRAWHQADNLFIVPIGTCQQLHWNAAQQQLEAVISGQDGDDDMLYLRLPVQRSAPQAIDTLIHILGEQNKVPLGKISGYVRMKSGRLEMEPLMVMTQRRAWALHAEHPPSTIVLPPASSLSNDGRTVDAILLARCQTQLIQWLHNGIRHQSPRAFEDMRQLAAAVHDGGFEALARLLRLLCDQIQQGQEEEWPATLTRAIVLRDALEQDDGPIE